MSRVEYNRNWYIAHKESVLSRHKARNKKWVRFIRHITDEIKLLTGCKHCGYDKHPRALDFHHRERDEKNFGISTATRIAAGLETLLAEINKCDILCANCHRIESHNERVSVGV
jgi:hypothetical protein